MGWTKSYVAAESNKINEDNDEIIISMEEEQKTLEYQETMKVDVENISKNKHGDQYMELFQLHFLN